MRLSLAPHAILLAALLCAGASAVDAADDFVVIVHPSVVGTKVKRADLAALFLKRALRWSSGGGLAVPGDQSGTSPVRKAFSDAVIQQPVAQVLQYWQKQMFSPSGLRPPPVKGSDAEVIAFVSKNAGAVGYISAGNSLPPELKTLEIID